MFAKNKNILIVLALVFFAIAPFLSNLNDPFVSDDWDFLYIAEHNDKSITHYFGTNYYGTNEGGSYRPMVNVFWFSAHKLFGLNPLGYHVGTLAFHTVNVLLIFFLISRLPWFDEKKRRWIGAASAIIFSLLHVHAEAINWISVINDTMMTTFYLLALFGLLMWYTAKKHRSWWYGMSLVATLLSLLTKEMAITIPFVVMAALTYEVLKKKLERKEILKRIYVLLPYIGIVFLYFVLRSHAIGSASASYVGSFVIHPFLIWRSYVTMLVSLFVSDELRVQVTEFIFNFQTGMLWAFGLILLSYLCRALTKQMYRFYWMLLDMLFLSIIPVFQFGVNFTPMYISEEGERYVYLPSVFFAVLMGLLAYTLWNKAKTKHGKMMLTFLFAFCLLYQTQSLLQKNARWGEASQTASSLVERTIAQWNEHAPDGVVLVGVPDTLHGAFIFRNTFARAVELSSGGAILEEDILVMRNRTVLLPDHAHAFGVERLERGQFLYEEVNGNVLIVSQPMEEQGDYRTELIDPVFELRAISHTHFSDMLKVELSQEFIESNEKKDVQVWFYHDMGWLVHEL